MGLSEAESLILRFWVIFVFRGRQFLDINMYFDVFLFIYRVRKDA